MRWMKWHCPSDTWFEIRALTVWGRSRYLSITGAPHNTESLVSREEQHNNVLTWSTPSSLRHGCWSYTTPPRISRQPGIQYDCLLHIQGEISQILCYNTKSLEASYWLPGTFWNEMESRHHGTRIFSPYFCFTPTVNEQLSQPNTCRWRDVDVGLPSTTLAQHEYNIG